MPAGVPVGAGQGATSALAVWSLVLGILAMVCFGVLAAIPAVICGHMARSAIQRDPALAGDGMALAGLILGYIAIAATFVFAAIWVALLFFSESPASAPFMYELF